MLGVDIPLCEDHKKVYKYQAPVSVFRNTKRALHASLEARRKRAQVGVAQGAEAGWYQGGRGQSRRSELPLHEHVKSHQRTHDRRAGTY